MHLLKLPYMARAICSAYDEDDSATKRVCELIAKGYSEGSEAMRALTVQILHFQRSREWVDPSEFGFAFQRATFRGFASKLVDEIAENGYYLPFVIDTHYRRTFGGSWVTDVMSSASGSEDYDECFAYLDTHIGIFRCDECDEVFPDSEVYTAMVRHNDVSICEGCRDNSFTYVEDLDTYIRNEDVCEALDRRGNRVFVSEGADYYHYDEEREIYVHEEYEGDSVIRGYHESKALFTMQPDDWTAKYGRFMGVELEVEERYGDGRNRNIIAKSINEAVNGDSRRIFFERDGSLRCGFEMITNPMSLPALRDVFKFLQTPVVTGLVSHKTDTCGLHVHVSRSVLTPLQIQKVVAFVNAPENEWFIRGLSRRYGAGFCSIRDKKIGKGIHFGIDRYEAVNLTNRRTIEFRIFKGSLKYEAVIAAIEFCHAIIEFCRPAVTSVNQLSAGAFLSFCSTQMAAETRVLRAYISSRLSGREELLDQEAA